MQRIRAVTYICPSLPVELIQLFLDVLESSVGCKTTLLYEWRDVRPQVGDYDPFKEDLVDIAFMPSSGYVSLTEEKNNYIELLPVSPVFKHPENKEGTSETYVDLIVHADKLKHNVSEILDLRGCRWACTPEGSLAHAVMSNALSELGENMTFFGSTHWSSSHLASVNMVLTKQVDAATIDANALICNRRYLYNGAKDIEVLTNFGPLSPYAIVANKKLSDDTKKKICNAFLSIRNDVRFDKFGLKNFVWNDDSKYDRERMLMEDIKSKKSKVPYY